MKNMGETKMPCKKRDFHKAVTKKRFVEEKKRDHIFYIFTDKDGKLFRRIHTKVSHGGSGDISKDLISMMYKQMNFESKGELEKYIDCSLSENEYREQLVLKGFKV
jgi:hypothetical protein